MALTFWNFWIYIIFNVLILVAFIIYLVWYYILDVRLRLVIIYPNNQMKIFKSEIKNSTATIYDKKTDTHKTYPINKKFIKYVRGRIPYTFFWDNIPIPLELIEKEKYYKQFTPIEIKLIKKINERTPIQIDIDQPTKIMKNNKVDVIEIDTCETFFSVLHTNFTLNLLKKPSDMGKAVKWGMILISIAVILAIVLHSMGIIDINQLLTGTAQK